VPAGYSAEAMRASLATYLGSPAKAYRELGWTSRPLREAERARRRWVRVSLS
jgi:hypothetical protein